MFEPHVITDADDDTVTAIGIRRRIEALVALGYSLTDLGERTGIDRRVLGDKVPRWQWPAIVDLFRRIELTPGPNERVRVDARRRGWSPPFAWDEDTIDDPAAEPAGIRPAEWVRGQPVPPDFVDQVLEHRELGRYDEQIAAAMGLSRIAFAKRLHRAGLPERSHGIGESAERPPIYGPSRYRLRFAPSRDALQGLDGVVRCVS